MAATLGLTFSKDCAMASHALSCPRDTGLRRGPAQRGTRPGTRRPSSLLGRPNSCGAYRDVPDPGGANPGFVNRSRPRPARDAPSERPDVAIVGAGPAGCATALAFAGTGAETVVFESAVPATRRLAGEWLHPAGVQALERLGVDLSAVRHCRVRGFIVHPEDGSTPITLPYPRGGYGLGAHHRSLVQGLPAA